MTMPPNRAQPELIGTVTMRRATEILSEEDSLATVDGNAAGVRTDDFPRAQFPHWVHRVRFQCKTCHMELFEPRAGTNPVTMAEIDQGEACGQCHDNTTAFAPTLTNCTRCHPVDLPVAAAPDGGGP
jgi:c(7)-type cytochrome triheme protein